MHRARSSRLSPSLAVAFVALLVALTPVAVAATKAVKRALFTNNAGKVDGIAASRKPKANQLLALDRGDHFPASVVAGGVKGDGGDPGAKGDPGTNGTGGTPGLAVVARLSSSASTPMPANTGTTQIPLTGGGWTQGASELDLFALSLTFTEPSGCSGTQGVSVTFTVGTTTVFMTPSPTLVPVGQSTIAQVSSPLFEPGTASPRTLTVTASNNCANPGSVDAVRVDVVHWG